MKFYLYLLFSVLFSLQLNAQHKGYQFEFTQSPLCIENGDTLDLSWAGGLNAPQFNTMDANKDGIDDLVLFEKSNGRMIVLLSDGQKYSYGFEYGEAFPYGPTGIYGWVIMRDFNCDGNNDIYTKTGSGAQIMRYLDGPVNYPLWTVVDPLIRYDSLFNIPISEADVPIIEDIDGDGDMDLATFEFSGGGKIEYFSNISIETTGSCGISEYVRETQCWGRIYECQTCGQYDINLAANCFINGNPNTSFCQPRLSLHAGSTSLAIDLDGDNDKDLLLGDIGCNQVSYLENIGNNTFAQFDSAQLGFPFNTTPIDFFVFPAMFFEDVDFDGEKDLMVVPNTSENVGGNVDMARSVHFYKNTGTSANPNFSYQQNNYLQDQMLDVGEYAYPALVDYDADGDLDLFIGNRGVNDMNSLNAQLYYYENTGSITNPEFTLVDTNFLNIRSEQVYDIRPFFHDVTGDGVEDICFTWLENNGFDYRFHFIPNTATTGSAMAFSLNDLQLYPLNGLPFFNGDVPVFYDVTGDGNDDLFLGISQFSYMKYYRNDGTISNPNFIEVNSDVGFIGTFLGNMQPSFDFDDFDGNGDVDMIFSDRRGRIKVYPNFINNINSTDTLFPRQDLIMNDTLSPGIPLDHKVNEFLKVASGDLNNDGQPDVLLGTKTGGIHILYNRSTPVNGLNNQFSKTGKLLKIFPIPSKEIVNIDVKSEGILEIRDVIGRLVDEKFIINETGIFSIDINNYENGIYFLKFESNEGEIFSGKMIKN